MAKSTNSITVPCVALRCSKSGDWIEIGPDNPRNAPIKGVWLPVEELTEQFGVISFERNNETKFIVSVSQ